MGIVSRIYLKSNGSLSTNNIVTDRIKTNDINHKILMMFVDVV